MVAAGFGGVHQFSVDADEFRTTIAGITEYTYCIGTSPGATDADIEMGRSLSDQEGEENTRTALMSYLRVIILYSQFPDEHAEALFWASKCFDKLKQSDRARELRAELTRSFPNSPWAKRVTGQ